MATVEEDGLVTKFREIFGEAPELTLKPEFPYEDEYERHAVKKVSYTLVSLEGDPGQEHATFAAGVNLEHNQEIVEYQRRFGLKVKRERCLAVFPSEEGETAYLPGLGRVICDLGEVQIIYL